MTLREIAKRVFECPKNKRDECPVAKVSTEIYGKPRNPVPYLGIPIKAKFIIIGINQGESNIEDSDFDNDLVWMEDFFNNKDFFTDLIWKNYERAARILNYSPENEEIIITNLVHCPTLGWTNPPKEWKLNNEEKERSIDLCNHFCLEIIKEVNPELILLHGLDVVKFFNKHYNWGLPDNIKSKDINGKIKEGDGRTFVLSRHLTRLGENKIAWEEALEEASKCLR
ncbi:MAG: hypothetical protein ABH874_08560 [Methanobacteriota archaeon]